MSPDLIKSLCFQFIALLLIIFYVILYDKLWFWSAWGAIIISFYFWCHSVFISMKNR